MKKAVRCKSDRLIEIIGQLRLSVRRLLSKARTPAPQELVLYSQWPKQPAASRASVSSWSVSESIDVHLLAITLANTLLVGVVMTNGPAICWTTGPTRLKSRNSYSRTFLLCFVTEIRYGPLPTHKTFSSLSSNWFAQSIALTCLRTFLYVVSSEPMCSCTRFSICQNNGDSMEIS